MKKGKPNPDDVFVGSKIRQQRAAKKMSQMALADAIGLTFQQVQKYEKGTNRVGSSRMMQIANALDVEPSFFFEGLSKGKLPSSSTSAGDVYEFAESAEGQKLIRAYQKIPKDMRPSIVRLVEKIADSQ